VLGRAGPLVWIGAASIPRPRGREPVSNWLARVRPALLCLPAAGDWLPARAPLLFEALAGALHGAVQRVQVGEDVFVVDQPFDRAVIELVLDRWLRDRREEESTGPSSPAPLPRAARPARGVAPRAVSSRAAEPARTPGGVRGCDR
jgi:hypothetical protein